MRPLLCEPQGISVVAPLLSGRHVTNAVEDARAITLAVLAARASGATVCPSEVARALADAAAADAGAGTQATDWRSRMPIVHAAVDQLLADGLIHLSWKGQALASRSGPYRINPGQAS